MALVPRPPLGRAAGAARRPARARLVLAGGDRAGRLRDAPDARLPDVGRDLLRHARDRARRPPHASTCARTSPARCAAPTSCYERDRRPRPATTRTSTCARSSASAPATSRRWPRSTASTSARSSRRVAAAARRLARRARGARRDKQLPSRRPRRRPERRTRPSRTVASGPTRPRGARGDDADARRSCSTTSTSRA